jgi:hypothetical protein
MKTTKAFAAIAALTIGMSSFAMTGVTVGAEEQGFTYDMSIYATDTHENTVYISLDDLKDGDYTFNAGIFIEDHDTLDMTLGTVETAWDGYDADGVDTKYITFQNLSDASTKNDTLNRDFSLEKLNEDGTIADTSVTAYFVPSCLSYLSQRGGTSYVTSRWVSYQNQYESFKGATLYAAGENQIKFTDNDGTEYVALLDYDANTGIATSQECYAINDMPTNRAEHIVLNDYDPTLPDGTPIPNSCTESTIISLDSWDSTTEWFMGKSDAYALNSFDVTVSADTPEGVYYVGFDNSKERYNRIWGFKIDENGKFCPEYIYPENIAYTDDKSRVNDTTNWLKIVVGSQNELAETTTAQITTPTIYGDVNLDNSVDLTDVIVIGKAVAGAVSLSSAQTVNGDVDDNGTVDTSDADTLLQFLLHKIDKIG